MHQYRLLRDNKESGPYSAADLQMMGLKSYDLIWQEGKSAAWRYPGELDELKSFAPPVEEQPFDRFYRKVERKETKPFAAASSTYAPKPVAAEQTQIRKGHIVVTMPGTMAKERPYPVPKSQPVYIRPLEARPAETTVVITDRTEISIDSAITDRPPSRPVTLMPYKWISIAASVLFVATLSMLLVNYQLQNKKITQLRDIVTQMQQNPPAASNGINRQVIHYPEEQQAGLILQPDTVKIIPVQPPVIKKAQTNKEVNPVQGVKKQPNAPIIKDDTGIIVQEKMQKPVVESEDGKRVAIKRDEADKNIMQLVKVNTNDYKTGLLGGINNLKVTLLNKSLVALKRVEVQIDYLGPESRVVKTQTVFFDNVAPGGDLLLDVPKSGRGVKVNCTIKKIST